MTRQLERSPLSHKVYYEVFFMKDYQMIQGTEDHKCLSFNSCARKSFAYRWRRTLPKAEFRVYHQLNVPVVGVSIQKSSKQVKIQELLENICQIFW